MFEAAGLLGPGGRGWGRGHGRHGLGTAGLPSLDTGRLLEGREQVRRGHNTGTERLPLWVWG